MPQIHWCCPSTNDVYRSAGAGRHHEHVSEAIMAARYGDALVVLSQRHPAPTAPLSSADWAAAREKGLRLFQEMPAGNDASKDHPALHRAVVPASSPLKSLPEKAILGLPTRKTVGLPSGRIWLASARVAGYDSASFGVPTDAQPMLVETNANGIPALFSSTCLSDVVRARFGPVGAWQALWKEILDWLQPGAGKHLRWTPASHPTFPPQRPLPRGAARQALARGIAWPARAGMLIGPDTQQIYQGPASQWPDRVGPAPPTDAKPGDGSLGILEGLSSRIDSDGTQPVRWWRRADCIGEMAGAYALASRIFPETDNRRIALRLGGHLLEKSILANGERADPNNPAYGLIGWNDVTRYYGDMDGYGVYYPDDMCRCLIGMLAARHVLDQDAWDQRIARALLANLRLSSTRGFVPDRVDEAPFEAGGGWEPHFRGGHTSFTAHYQGWVWAAFLRAYAMGGDRIFLERARAGLRRLVGAYPDRWNCANGSVSLEESRILLPLAWLVRADDQPEHRAWLTRFVTLFRKRQDRSGLPAEALARQTSGVPQSNAEYGVAETSLLQRNGDPVADLLYTANFAAIGLHEAAALGLDEAKTASDALADALVRIQVSSQSPQLDGAWFRAFDFHRWEYWASNADVGWGAWAVETGWTQSWITAFLALRETRTSLWECTGSPALGSALRRWRPRFLPDSILASAPTNETGS